jgi:hypothetical protein
MEQENNNEEQIHTRHSVLDTFNGYLKESGFSSNAVGYDAMKTRLPGNTSVTSLSYLQEWESHSKLSKMMYDPYGSYISSIESISSKGKVQVSNILGAGLVLTIGNFFLQVSETKDPSGVIAVVKLIYNKIFN